MNKNCVQTTLIIVEGAKTEMNIFNNLQLFPFPWRKIKFVTIPAKENIYMLWETLKKDDFETDLLEVLKEKVDLTRYGLENASARQFAEIYLFFDFDGHQHNLPKGVTSIDVLSEMLEIFNNPTDLGKLYISYPMIEAIRDWTDNDCIIHTNCYWNIDNLKDYKMLTAKNSTNKNTNIINYTYPQWKTIITNYLYRVSCLFTLREIPTFKEYKANITPQSIFEQQVYLINNKKIFVLSAIPEFILDYFREDFWRKWVKNKHIKNLNCRDKI